MKFSRRHFLKAAGAGGPAAVALTTVGAGVAGVVGAEDAAAAQTPPSPLTIPAPMTKETGSFTVNGKPYRADYEARTTLWEVIAVKLGLTGTNRSCNRASCGACSVLIDGVPFYSCHTLATEAVGKKIFTVEGLGDEKNLHPMQQVGYRYMAADCGYCTGRMGGHREGAARQEPESDGRSGEGRACRTHLQVRRLRRDRAHVVDTGKVLRGEAEIV
jgi:aerobic-type carbon monoxide dehydrogenase small subunit (CoxS/CutS family)